MSNQTYLSHMRVIADDGASTVCTYESMVAVLDDLIQRHGCTWARVRKAATSWEATPNDWSCYLEVKAWLRMIIASMSVEKARHLSKFVELANFPN